MATIRSILGDIEGSAGQLTFARQNGQNVLRQKVGRNASNTAAQQAVRARFALLTRLYRELVGLAKVGLPPVGGQSAYNQFVGLNFGATFYDGATGTAGVDYGQLVVSAGSAAVDQLDNLEATVAPNGDVTARWSADYGEPADRVYVAVLDRTSSRVYLSSYFALRVDGGLTVATGAALPGPPTYTLLAVPVAAGGRASGMTGNVNVTQ